jgi:hypothetical protein
MAKEIEGVIAEIPAALEPDHHATPRQRADVHAFAHSLHQQAGIQIVGGEAIAGMR